MTQFLNRNHLSTNASTSASTDASTSKKAIFKISILLTCLGFTFTAFGAIFGQDDRQEVFKTETKWQQIALSIAGKVSLEILSPAGGGFKIEGSPLSRRVCSGERFSEQIVGPSCTGFLVKSNILVTAAHCINTQLDCDNFAWVFGYSLKSAGDSSYTNVAGSQVYRCKKIVSRQYAGFGAVDYAILELDRAVVSERPPLTMGFNTPVAPGTALVSIGHSNGLPMKLAGGGTIQQISSENRMLDTDLDIFTGNSGGPVFDALTGTVVGITSQGNSDHIRLPGSSCRSLKICKPGDKCVWSSSSRIVNLMNEPVLKD